MKILQFVVASVTFALWAASVVAYLFFRVPIDLWVHLLTMAVFSFVFGPGVFRVLRSNGNGRKAAP